MGLEQIQYVFKLFQQNQLKSVIFELYPLKSIVGAAFVAKNLVMICKGTELDTYHAYVYTDRGESCEWPICWECVRVSTESCAWGYHEWM